jgi:hypothetical protein
MAASFGLVCGRCDQLALPDTAACDGCGNDLRSLVEVDAPAGASRQIHSNSPRGDRSSPGSAMAQRTPRVQPSSAQETSMDQAKYFVCQSCMTPVPTGHKFCGRCGAPIPEEVMNLRVDFFSDMQDPSKARIVLIRGEGMDGLSYHLKADQHIVGRQGQLEFPEDPFVSPKHANFFYRDGRLVIRDEGSLNGVYLRVHGDVEIVPGDTFMAGEQVFRLDPTPPPSDAADAAGTYFYSSPKYPTAFRINQILEGGAIGMTVCARAESLNIVKPQTSSIWAGDISSRWRSRAL